MRKEIAIVGLGKMGKNMKARLEEQGWKVFGFDRNLDLEKIVQNLTDPRVVWLMVPVGKPVQEIFLIKTEVKI
jgi:6-phosphogluconate dehydrogenase